MKHQLRWLLACALLTQWAVAQSLPPLPSGLPPVNRIELPTELDPQLLGMASSPDGLLFVGHVDGVAAFDGRRWQTTIPPQGVLIRALAHDGQDTLYVGGEENFGYLRLDAAGLPQYTDLAARATDLLDGESFEQIWEILVSPDGVFFNADRHLFQYQPQDASLRLWRHDDRFGAQALLGEQVVVQFRGIGLKAYDGEDFVLIPGGEMLSEQAYHLLALPEGGLLALMRDNSFLHYHQGQVSALTLPEGFPVASSLGAALALDDGTLVFGSAKGTLHILDRERSQHQTFQLASDFIVDLAPSHHGGVLVQSGSELWHLSWPSPWLRIGPESGLVGSVSRIDLWQDQWLVLGTSGALISADTGLERNPLSFRTLDWSDFEIWDWLRLGPERALLADSYDVLEVGPDGSAVAVNAEDIYPKVLRRSSSDPELIYVAADYGLLLLRDAPDGWQTLIDHKELLGFVTGMEEVAPGELLVATATRGLFRVVLDMDAARVLAWQSIGLDQGLDYGNSQEVSINRLPEFGLIANSRAGFFIWKEGRFEHTDLGGLDSMRGPGQTLMLSAGPNGSSWAGSARQLWRRETGGSWINEDISKLNPGPLSSINLVEDRLIIGGTGSLLLFDENVIVPERQDVKLRLGAVLLRARDDSWTRSQPLDGRPLAWPQSNAFVQFEFALPELQRPDLVRTRYRLLGHIDQFSEWAETSRVIFSNLKPGHYRFEAEARDPAGALSRIEPFEFAIESPWYRRPAILLLWVLIGLGLLALSVNALVRWRLQRAMSEQQRLSDMVDQRTAELAAANRRLDDMAHVDGLTSIANRRRLEDYLEQSWQRGEAAGGELAVIILDVDHFKHYNDTRGHQSGDDALQEIAGIMSDCLRRSEDLVARYGGEEFVCVLPNSNLEQVRTWAETIRARVEASAAGITVSIGVASASPASNISLRDLMEAADRNLYRAKKEGRNRVIG